MSDSKALGVRQKTGKEMLNSFTPPKAIVSQNKPSNSAPSTSTPSGSQKKSK